MRPNLQLIANADMQHSPSGAYEQFQARQFDIEVDRLLRDDLSLYREQAVKQTLMGNSQNSTSNVDESLIRSRSVVSSLSATGGNMTESTQVYLDLLNDDQGAVTGSASTYESTVIEEKLLNATIPKHRNQIVDTMYISKPDVDLSTDEEVTRLDEIERLYNHAHALKLACQKLRDRNQILEDQLLQAHQRIRQLEAELDVTKNKSAVSSLNDSSRPQLDTWTFYKDSYNSLLEKHKQLSADFEALRAISDITQITSDLTGNTTPNSHISKPSSIVGSAEHQPSQLLRSEIPERIPSHSMANLSSRGDTINLPATQRMISSGNSPPGVPASSDSDRDNYKQLVRYEVEISRLKLKIKTLTDEHNVTLSIYKDKLAQANEKNGTLTANIAKLTEACAQHEKRLGNVKEIMKEMNDVKSNFNDLLTDYNKKCTQCDALMKDLESLRNDLKQAVLEGEKSRQECIRLSQGESEQSMVIEDKTRKMQELEEQLQVANRDAGEAIQRIQQMDNKIVSLQQQVQELHYQAKQTADLHTVEITNLLKSIDQLSTDIENRNLFIYNMHILSMEAIRYTKNLVTRNGRSTFTLEPLDIPALLSQKFNLASNNIQLANIFRITTGPAAQQMSRVKRLNNGYMIPPISDAILNIFTEVIAALGSCVGTQDVSSTAQLQTEIQQLKRDYDERLHGLMVDLHEAKRFVAESAGREQGLSVALNEVKSMYRAANSRLVEAQKRVETLEYKVEEMNKLRSAEQQAFTTKLKRVLESCRGMNYINAPLEN